MTREEALRLVGDDSVREFRLTKGDDVMLCKVLDDGTWRIDVQGAISAVNHGNAAQFLTEAARPLGGETKITQGHGHVHEDAHAHEHHHH